MLAVDTETLLISAISVVCALFFTLLCMWRYGKNFARGKSKYRKCWRNLGKGNVKNEKMLGKRWRLGEISGQFLTAICSVSRWLRVVISSVTNLKSQIVISSFQIHF